MLMNCIGMDLENAARLANYGIECWLTLQRYVPYEDFCFMLKT